MVQRICQNYLPPTPSHPTLPPPSPLLGLSPSPPLAHFIPMLVHRGSRTGAGGLIGVGLQLHFHHHRPAPPLIPHNEALRSWVTNTPKLHCEAVMDQSTGHQRPLFLSRDLCSKSRSTRVLWEPCAGPLWPSTLREYG